MEQRQLGRTGLYVSALGFGASEIGYQGVALKTVQRLINSALDAGLNVIDTAACYDSSEELIGRAAGKRRKDFYIFTKCGHASGLDADDWTPALVEKSIARSLKRLRTDYLDLVQFHSCEEETLRRGDVTAALQRARDQGLTRFIGYSGDGAAALYAARSGAFDTLQMSVNIADQEAIDLVLPEAISRNIGVIAKRPIANASWIGGWNGPIDSYSEPYRRRLRKLRYDFLELPANDSIGIALRFTLSVPGVHTAIMGTTKPSRWEGNAALLERGPLTLAEFDAIRSRWNEAAPADWIGLR
jgi:aryl-alcohol dehydrogenase-like predicted oxidoreductase